MTLKKITSYMSLCSAAALLSCNVGNDVAMFDYFDYTGNDDCYGDFVDNGTSYCNPILSGYYPDPSICRKGDTYYLVNSSFSHFPGIPIFKSTDLVHWQQIGHVLDRASQLNVDNLELSQGIFAPAIEYNPHNDTFYLITTCVYCGGNFIVKTQDPESDWSDPIWLPKVGGIDPSLFFDSDGSAYIVNNDSPQGGARWDGHRAIWMHRYDTENDCTVGESWQVVDGGICPDDKPVWIEGPHVYNFNGKYMIMAAEGGTSINHSEVILTSDKVEGPYTPAAVNPILTQRDLPADRERPVTCTGHADIVEDVNGDHWAVFLACRPYPAGQYNTGRETFLLPVDMSGETPIILERGKEVPYVVEKNDLKRPDNFEPYGGNFNWRNDFDTPTLHQRFFFVRNVRTKWYNINNGMLNIKPIATSLDSVANPAMVAFRQQHLTFTAETKVTFTPQAENEMAGVVCYQNDKNYIAFGITQIDGKDVLAVVNCICGRKNIAATKELDSTDEVILIVDADKETYTFRTQIDGAVNSIVASVNATHLSTDKAGGFVGAVVGMFATSNK